MSKLTYFWLTALMLLGVVSCSIDLNQPTAVESVQEHQDDNAQATTDTASTPSEIQPIADSEANADVLFVKASQSSSGTWNFTVTVEHPDIGWDDYADGWDVVLPDGTVVKTNPNDPFTRLLLHPHETEQPFTRSQSNLQIPGSVTQVTVRAHDLVDGWGGQEIVVDLTQSSGEGFEVTNQ